MHSKSSMPFMEYAWTVPNGKPKAKPPVKDTAERALNEYEHKGQTLRAWIDKIVSGEYQPQKRAHWYINPDGYYPQCSNCKNEPQGREMTDYCPSCGAKMDGDKK